MGDTCPEAYRVDLEEREALIRALLNIITANNDFRDGMPKAYRDGREWEGDPLQDACDAAQGILDSVGTVGERGR